MYVPHAVTRGKALPWALIGKDRRLVAVVERVAAATIGCQTLLITVSLATKRRVCRSNSILIQRPRRPSMMGDGGIPPFARVQAGSVGWLPMLLQLRRLRGPDRLEFRHRPPDPRPVRPWDVFPGSGMVAAGREAMSMR